MPRPLLQLARELGIDYIFIGPAEQKGNPAASLAKFDETARSVSAGLRQRRHAHLRGTAVTLAGFIRVPEGDGARAALGALVGELAATEERQETRAQRRGRREQPLLAAGQAGDDEFGHVRLG